MESVSVNKQFKEYRSTGGTMNFVEFVDKYNRRKNSSGNSEVEDIFKKAIGDDMFGQAPVVRIAPTVKENKFKNDIGGTSSGVNTDNMTLGINNYVIVGTVVVIVGAIALNYYLKHKK
jgi:hypothetical protein